MEQKPPYKWQLARVRTSEVTPKLKGKWLYVKMGPPLETRTAIDYNSGRSETYKDPYMVPLLDPRSFVSFMLIESEPIELYCHFEVEVEPINIDEWINGKDFPVPEEFKCRQ